MADGDGAAVLVDARVVVVDAEVVEEAEHLDGERLVELEEPDVVDREAGLAERLLRARHGADAHDLGLDACEREGHQGHLRREAELLHGIAAREQGGRGAVVEARRVAGRDAAVRAERGAEPGESLQRRLGAHGLVARRQPPAALGAGRDGNEVRLDLAVRVREGGLLLARERVAVGAFAGERGEPVVDPLGRVAHVEGVLAHEALGEEARVRVRVEAHGVAAHVLDAARDREVVGAERDAARGGGDARHGAGAHPVDGVAGHRAREAGQERGRAAQGQALVARLGRGRDGDLVDPVLRHLRVPLEQPDHGLDHQVVGAGPPVHALLTRSSERGAYPVHEMDFGSLDH